MMATTNDAWEKRLKEKWTKRTDLKYRPETAFFTCKAVEGGGFQVYTGSVWLGSYIKVYNESLEDFRRQVYRLVYELGGDPQIPAMAFKDLTVNGVPFAFAFEARVNMDTYQDFLRAVNEPENNDE